MIRNLLVVPLILLLTASSAAALEGTIQASDAVIVWKNKAAHDEGIGLMRAKANPRVIIPLIACIVPPGTRVYATAIGWITHDIVVTNGPEAGCRGNIAHEYFRSDRAR